MQKLDFHGQHKKNWKWVDGDELKMNYGLISGKMMSLVIRYWEHFNDRTNKDWRLKGMLFSFGIVKDNSRSTFTAGFEPCKFPITQETNQTLDPI